MVGHNAAKKHEIEFTLSLLAQQVFPYISWLLIQEDAREYARVCVPHARRACLQLVRPVAGQPSAGEHFRTMLGFGSYILNIPIEGNSRDKSSFQRKREKKKKEKKKIIHSRGAYPVALSMVHPRDPSLPPDRTLHDLKAQMIHHRKTRSLCKPSISICVVEWSEWSNLVSCVSYA
jgi:hypothetical protein